MISEQYAFYQLYDKKRLPVLKRDLPQLPVVVSVVLIYKYTHYYICHSYKKGLKMPEG